MSRPALPAASVEERLERIERRLRDVQALTARAYEASQGWERILRDVREDPAYERAYAEPEPLVSVRIATYDQAAILTERTLPSLQRQTYERWEANVVGDACTDDTARRVAAMGDDRIRFVNLPVRGPYPEDEVARWQVAGTAPANAAIAAAQGTWIAPLDHDDEFADDHLEVLLGAVRETRAEIAYGRHELVSGETGEPLNHVGGAWPPVYGQFGFQDAIYHAGLGRFRYDMACRFADEPGDWNVARRWWELGVRFHFVDRVVTTVHYTPREPWARAWMAHQLGAADPEPSAPAATVDEAAVLRGELEHARTVLEAMRASASWRVTAPLRALGAPIRSALAATSSRRRSGRRARGSRTP